MPDQTIEECDCITNNVETRIYKSIIALEPFFLFVPRQACLCKHLTSLERIQQCSNNYTKATCYRLYGLLAGQPFHSFASASVRQVKGMQN